MAIAKILSSDIAKKVVTEAGDLIKNKEKVKLKKAEDFIQAIRTSDGSIDYAIAEERIGRGIKLNGTESIEELIELFLRNVKKDVIGSIALAGTAGAGGV